MKEEIIQQVRKEYNKTKKEKDTLLSYNKELKELSENEKVKRFLELSKLVDREYSGPSEETMIRRAYANVFDDSLAIAKITDSAEIMVFMGSYIKNSSLEEENNDYITYEKDPDTSYKAYMDLETTEVSYIEKDYCLDFETEYLVLYPPVSEYSEAEYFKKYRELQNWFKTQLIHRSQADVIEELKKKYSKEYNGLAPSFHKMDTILGMPIDEFIKRNGEDGYVENFCLSKEYYLRVKLYRKQLNEKS